MREICLYTHSEFPLVGPRIIETDFISWKKSNEVIFYLRNNEKKY